MEYERLPKSGGSRKQYLARHRIAKSNMSRWRRKKENQRFSWVKDNLSPEKFRGLGFSPQILRIYVRGLFKNFVKFMCPQTQSLYRDIC